MEKGEKTSSSQDLTAKRGGIYKLVALENIQSSEDLGNGEETLNFRKDALEMKFTLQPKFLNDLKIKNNSSSQNITLEESPNNMGKDETTREEFTSK